MAKKNEKYRKKRNCITLLGWGILFLGMILFSIFQLFDWEDDNQKIKKLEEEIKQEVTPKKIDEQGELVNPPAHKTDDYWYYINFPFYEVNFQNLIKKNPDTVAFIHVPNTNINYPIVQSKDNDYYLTHAFDKSKNDAGWVYMDYRNDKQFKDDNTVIYGHGRLNKTVFGSLKQTLTPKWQEEKSNYVIYISTPKENFIYQIFSIYTINAESYYIRPDFKNQADKKKWIFAMKKRNQSPINVEVNEHDKVITLSTCQNNDNGRIVVQGKLIKKQVK